MGHKHDRNRPPIATVFDGNVPGGVPIIGQSGWVPLAHAELAVNTRNPGQFGLQVKGPNGPNDIGVMQLFVDLMLQNMQQWLDARKAEAAAIAESTSASPAASVKVEPESIPDNVTVLSV